MTTEPTKRSSAHIRWPGAVVGLLLIPIVANGYLMWRANSDPSFAVEEDYYAKAEAWDDKMAQDVANDALGWRLMVTAGVPKANGSWSLAAILVDEEGVAITDARVTVETFHRARARDVWRGAMVREGDSGSYLAAIPNPRVGLWEVRLVAQRGGQRFVARRDVELHP